MSAGHIAQYETDVNRCHSIYNVVDYVVDVRSVWRRHTCTAMKQSCSSVLRGKFAISLFEFPFYSK